MICHIASLASVYHKPPTAFVEGTGGLKRVLPTKLGEDGIVPSSQVIPEPGSLIGDLLSMDLGGGASAAGGGNVDLLSGGIDNLLTGGQTAGAGQPAAQSNNSILGDIFGLGTASSTTFYIPPKQEWLNAGKGKGLEIMGTFSRKNGTIFMDMTFSNKAMQPLSGFGIQFNKNSFGLAPAQPLNVPSIPPNQSVDVSLPLNTAGPVAKMEPLTNLQVAIKDNVDVFYFATIVPSHVYFGEDGNMEKKVFLATWKDIPAANEIQFTIESTDCNSDGVSTKMHQNNVFTVAKRTVDGQDMVYQSIKFTNNVWALCELKLAPNSNSISVRKIFYKVLKYFIYFLISVGYQITRC